MLEVAWEEHWLIVETSPSKQEVSQQNLQVESAWNDVFQALNDNICQPGLYIQHTYTS